MIASANDFAIRYRVFEVLGDAWTEGRFFANKEREFKTHKGAEAYRDELSAQGKTAVIQSGIIRWLSEEEASEEAMRLQAEGARLQ